jgi:5-methylthioadenosine/S-adenosylhomocysteine deaminase
MAEVRVLHEALPRLEPRRLIEMVTAMGAIALGVEDRFGVLEPGMQADLAVFDLDAAGDPEAALVREAGRDTVRAVLAGGTWRVLDGELVSPSPAAVAVAAESAARSVAALELHDASTSPARERSAL